MLPANQEYFQEMTPEIGVLNARAMHKITLRLMYKDDPKIENQRQWQSFHNFVDMAASSDSAVKLREVSDLTFAPLILAHRQNRRVF